MTATTPTLRRRWQRFVLRTQGRLDGESADRILPWTLAIGLFVVLAALSLAAVRSLDGGSGMAPWIQAAWRRQHGGAGTPVGGVDPAAGTWSLASEPLLLLGRFAPVPVVLVLFQSFVIAVGVVPLWRLARHEAHLRVGATSSILLAYALAPTLHRTNLTVFHPEAIALPALMSAMLQARRQRWVPYGVLVALVLAARADLGLSVAALGALVALAGHRRVGAITAGIGVAWTTAAVLIIHPQVPDRALTPAGEFVARSQGPLAAVPKLLTAPWEQVRLLLSEPSIGFLVVVLAPLLFLPLVSPRRMGAALPCLALAMIADTAVQEVAQRGVINLSPAAAHIAPAMAFVFVALIFSLERIGELSVTRINVDRRILLALVAGSLLLFVTESPTSPYRSPWSWGGQDAVDGARLAAADLVRDDEAVAASPQALALVAARADLVALPLVPTDLGAAALDRIDDRTDVVLLDTTGTDAVTDRPFWTTADRTRVVDELVADGFVVIYDAEGITALRRTTA
ncbi:MAG: DUF2079 domain-containing protein [Acidimicrobiales bacterium]|nr:DUF2079 domain-containing protein [Acidimicrobiales bacterium]